MFIALRTLANRIERRLRFRLVTRRLHPLDADDLPLADLGVVDIEDFDLVFVLQAIFVDADDDVFGLVDAGLASSGRSEEHTSELQSLMRISYAVFCLKKKTHKSKNDTRKQ